VEKASDGGLDILSGELVDEGRDILVMDFNTGSLGVTSLVTVVIKGDFKINGNSVLRKVVGLTYFLEVGNFKVARGSPECAFGKLFHLKGLLCRAVKYKLASVVSVDVLEADLISCYLVGVLSNFRNTIITRKMVDFNQIFLVLVENVDLSFDCRAGFLSVDCAGKGGGHVL
jgi:hypothetical protein